MTYAIEIGPWLIGPFQTDAAATFYAERHGIDTWRLRQMDDPAEAPAKLARLRQDLREMRANAA